MKKLIMITAVIALTLSLFVSPSRAEEAKGPAVSGSASIDIMSQYIWRGQQLSDEMAFQPSVGITYGGFGANIWSNYDEKTTAITETDFTLNYTFSVDKIGFDVGYIFYTFPDSDFDTSEIYVAASYDVMLSPSLTIYYDFDEGEGAFIVASIGHSIALPKGMALDLGASASYTMDNTVMGTEADGSDLSDFYNADLSASLSIPVTDAISISPMIAYSFALSDDAETVLEGISSGVTGEADSDVFYGGVNVSLSF